MSAHLTDSEVAALYASRFQRGVPEGEKAEMQQQLHGHFLDTSKALEMQQALPQDMQGAQVMLNQIQKAITTANRTQRPEKGLTRRSAFDDPQMPTSVIPGVVPKLGKLPPEMLRAMAAQDPIVEAILQIQKNRTLRHAKWVKSGVQAMLEGQQGFDIVHTSKEAYEELTPAEERERAEVANFLINSGDAPRFTSDGSMNREDYKREHLEQVLAHMVNQRYVLDAVALEIERDRGGKNLKGLYVVDGGSIYHTDPRSWPYGSNRQAVENPTAAYVQLYRSQIITALGSQDLYYDYANPRDQIGLRGYGQSEVEMSVKLTTGILNVLTTNNAIFDRGAVPPGILYMAGQVNNNSLLAFQEEWDSYRLGAGGGHGLPAMVMNDPQAKLSFIRTDGQPTEMQFSAYVNFLAAIRCAIFGIDVTEINVSPFGGSNGGLNSGKDTQTRIDESKNRAFMPWLSRVERIFNEIIAQSWGGRWRFAWVGAERQEPGALRELFTKVATVDETREVIFKMRAVGGLAGGSLANNTGIAQLVLSSVQHGAAKQDTSGKIVGTGHADAPAPSGKK